RSPGTLRPPRPKAHPQVRPPGAVVGPQENRPEPSGLARPGRGPCAFHSGIVVGLPGCEVPDPFSLPHQWSPPSPPAPHPLAPPSTTHQPPCRLAGAPRLLPERAIHRRERSAKAGTVGGSPQRLTKHSRRWRVLAPGEVGHATAAMHLDFVPEGGPGSA